jgi:hypothetical protein
MLRRNCFRLKPDRRKTDNTKFKNGKAKFKRTFKQLKLPSMKKVNKASMKKNGEKPINSKILNSNL